MKSPVEDDLSHYDHLFNNAHGESSDTHSDMDQSEIEALLYSQIYHEQQQQDECVDLLESAEVVETKTSESGCSQNLSLMLNYSAREFMSPQPDKQIHGSQQNSTAHTRNSECEIVESLEAKSSVVKKKKKCKKKKEVIIVSDVSDEHDNKAKRKKKKDGEMTPVAKKKKKTSKKVYLDSDSDSNLMVLGDSGMVVSEEEDLDVNVVGLKSMRRDNSMFTNRKCKHSAKVDLSTVTLDTWDGSPALTTNQALTLLQPGTWSCDEDTRRLYSRFGRKANRSCLRCGSRGHDDRHCPGRPVVCNLCGEVGHRSNSCVLKKLCSNCDGVGHLKMQCEMPKRRYYVLCHRCNLTGHRTTTKEGDFVEVDQKENKPRYCYNCGHKGHFGNECRKEAMDIHWNPKPAFTGVYDWNTPDNQPEVKAMSVRHKKRLTPKQIRKQRKTLNGIEGNQSHRNKTQQPKGPPHAKGHKTKGWEIQKYKGNESYKTNGYGSHKTKINEKNRHSGNEKHFKSGSADKKWTPERNVQKRRNRHPWIRDSSDQELVCEVKKYELRKRGQGKEQKSRRAKKKERHRKQAERRLEEKQERAAQSSRGFVISF